MVQRTELIRLNLFVALIATVMLGCGGSGNAYVSGTVTTSDGSPLQSARVIAREDSTSKTSYGTADAEGRYELIYQGGEKGVPPGNYTVTILENLEVDGRYVPPTIPARYSNLNQSGLTFQVEPGERKEFDITVEPMKSPPRGRR